MGKKRRSDFTGTLKRRNKYIAIDYAKLFQPENVKVMKCLRLRIKTGALFPPIESVLSILLTFISYFK